MTFVVSFCCLTLKCHDELNDMSNESTVEPVLNSHLNEKTVPMISGFNLM